MVGFPFLPTDGLPLRPPPSPFSRSRLERLLPAGGDCTRTAVRRFSLAAGAVLRPVRRRETRFNDLRTSHWRFLAMKKRAVEMTVFG